MCSRVLRRLLPWVRGSVAQAIPLDERHASRNDES